MLSFSAPFKGNKTPSSTVILTTGKCQAYSHTQFVSQVFLPESFSLFNYRILPAGTNEPDIKWIRKEEIWVVFQVEKEKPPSCLPLVLPSKQLPEKCWQRFIFWFMHWANLSGKGLVVNHLGLLGHKVFSANSQFCICSMKIVIIICPLVGLPLLQIKP